MASDTSVFGGVIAAIAVGLAALVYGMQLSAGQSFNAPSIIGGVIIVAAVAVLALRIIRLPSHE